MDSVGEGESGKIWENGIETCKISCMKRVASPGLMLHAGCLGLVHWDDLEGRCGEEGGRGGLQLDWQLRMAPECRSSWPRLFFQLLPLALSISLGAQLVSSPRFPSPYSAAPAPWTPRYKQQRNIFLLNRASLMAQQVKKPQPPHPDQLKQETQEMRV